jgi:hypothetical protein
LSPPVGYRPDRIATLDRRTRDAIADLRNLRCTDSAASGAMRTVLLTQRNLEDHWMPLILAIRASEAMTSWNFSVVGQIETVGMQLDQWFSFVDARDQSISFADLSDEELLDQLYVAGHFNLAATGKSIDELIASDDPFWSEEFPAYASEVAARVATDPDFASQAAASAGNIPLIGIATHHADFPDSFIVAAVGPALAGTRWSDPMSTAGANALVEHLLDLGPDGALDALLDPTFSLALLQPSGLSDDAVDTILRGGLYDAVLSESVRFVDGATALQIITGHVNGPLDGGMRPAAAQALAFTMRGYLPHIAPGVKFEDDDSPVRMVDADGQRLLDLGTYPEVSNLLGSIMRDHEAQVLIGAALGFYTDDVITELGGDLLDGTDISAIAHFGDLLRESLSNEKFEMVLAAAAATARREQAGDDIGFGINVAQSYFAVGSATKAITERGIEELTSRLANLDPEQMPNASLRQATYDNITLSIVTMMLTTPSVRRDLGVESVTDEQWDRIAADLDVIDSLQPGADREAAVFDLERTIVDAAPEVDAVLGEVRAKEGFGELTESTWRDTSIPEPSGE